jgi:hypothetical protein
MTFDEAVALFDAELPGWYWSVMRSSTGCSGCCALEISLPGCEKTEDYDLFVVRFTAPGEIELANPIEIEIPHPSTPAQVLVALIEAVKEARRNARAAGGPEAGLS